MLVLLTVLVNVAATAVSAHGLGSRNQLSSGCDTSGPVSCSIDPPPSDSCCYESPEGLLLQTQFWETHPSTGPRDSWTIHGLWADYCDGTFPKRGCDPSRAYTDIAGLLRDQGAGDTLSYMERYWVDYHGQNEHFWEHEWDNHGTCYNTLRPSCLPPDSPEGAEAVAYFQQVVALFRTLPTYDWLARQGITPHPTRSHTLSELTDALRAASGFTPALECTGDVLNQISWYFYLRGSALDGEFVPIGERVDSTTRKALCSWATMSDSPTKSKCPSRGILYPPKTRTGFFDSTFQVSHLLTTLLVFAFPISLRIAQV
ncbi:ribonuclease T2-like protein [Lactifluus subvellereus]|nr:ribonuclease T2-like protein [Lactifluus subvellereus]